MKRFFIIILCLMGLSVFADRRAQIMAQRKAGFSWVDPSGSNTLYAWWVSSDVAALTNCVNDFSPWIDRVTGRKLSNHGPCDTSSGGPSNVPPDIYFRGNAAGTIISALSNAPALSPGTNSTICVIFKPHAVTANSNPILLYSPYDGSQSPPGGLFIDKTSSKLEWGFFPASVISAALTVDTKYDLIMNQSNVFFYAITNGVGSARVSTFPPAGGWPWQFVGWDFVTAVSGYNGYLYEIMVWSNSFSSIQTSNVHYYATNTYSYTP